jgi:hypothetical protein
MNAFWKRWAIAWEPAEPPARECFPSSATKAGTPDRDREGNRYWTESVLQLKHPGDERSVNKSAKKVTLTQLALILVSFPPSLGRLGSYRKKLSLFDWQRSLFQFATEFLICNDLTQLFLRRS